MGDYIVYNEHSSMLRRFNTQQEGIDYIDWLTLQWKNLAGRSPYFKLCFNGHESVDLYDNSLPLSEGRRIEIRKPLFFSLRNSI